jgi:glycogen operon protein
VRRFWRGDGGQVSELASRLAGSSDLYEHSGRRPYASINFVTCHDGFTLADLVSYNEKHNEANGEDNRDGESNNNSWNCGVEGPTDDPDVKALRARQQRNLLATLLFSQGVPMICAGDEIGRTQRGNNNAYCQDNEISWLDWDVDDAKTELLDFVRGMVALRKRHPVFRRRKFFQGRRIRGAEVKDLTWFEPNGREMTDKAWEADFVRSLMVRLAGEGLDEIDEQGEPISDDTFLVLLNAADHPVAFTLPAHHPELQWERLLDTGDLLWNRPVTARRDRYRLGARSMALFRAHRRGKEERRALGPSR